MADSGSVPVKDTKNRKQVINTAQIVRVYQDRGLWHVELTTGERVDLVSSEAVKLPGVAGKRVKKAEVRNLKRVPVTDDDRALAKSVGLGLIHFRVLRALVKGAKSPTDAFSYREIEKLTGYYSPLAGIMHTDQIDPENSLCKRGLTRMATENRGRDITVFSATEAGRKLLAAAKVE